MEDDPPCCCAQASDVPSWGVPRPTVIRAINKTVFRISRLRFSTLSRPFRHLDGSTVAPPLRCAILSLRYIGHGAKEPDSCGDQHRKEAEHHSIFDAAAPPIAASGLRRVGMNVTAIIDDTVPPFRAIFTFAGNRLRQIGRADRRLAVTAGNVEHVIRLTKSGDAPAQGPHQLLPGFDRGAQMRGAGRKVAMVQIIGL
ncbi:hypothetical protein chiPu_0030895, partial [Chiloscyllium punctatum]|nr:hypothetical protein [Chiloscyllium punctatum]